MRRTAKLVGVLLLAGSLDAPLTAAAQEPAPEPEEYTETNDDRVVNLEAVVTDKSGRPVRGLTAADFRLLVDGREMPVDYFTEVVEGETAARPAAPEESSPDAPPPVPAPASGRVGRSYLLFVDDSFSIATQRNMVLDQIEKSLPLLGPEDRMAIVAFDGMKLAEVSGWTGDRAALKAAFELARQRFARGHLVLAERRWAEDDQELLESLGESGGVDWGGEAGIAQMLGGGASGRAPVNEKHYSWLLRATDAAATALRGFPPPPSGRKIFLLLSGGWPLPQLLGPLVRDANRLGYTVYPVDVPGIDLMSTGDMAHHRMADIRQSPTHPWEAESHYTLELLARATGGKASLNSARLNAFARAVEDSSSYYWLGFTPAWRADDQHHAVRLEARRPGLTIRSRRSYSDLARKTEEAMHTESLLLFGKADEGRPGLRVELGTPRRISLVAMEVPVTLELPLDALDLARSGEGWVAAGQLSLGALDRWGARSDLPVIPLRFELREVPKPGERARYRTTLQLRRIEQRLVFRVSAERSGALLWEEMEIGPKGAG